MSMESSEIVRRNEAIARFMGWVYVEESEEQWAGYKANGMEREFYMVESLCFHTEWSWIMPCVEKMLYGKPDAKFTIWYETGEPREFLLNSIWLLVSDYCLALQEPKS